MDTCWIFVFLHYFDMQCALDMHVYSLVCVLYLFLCVFMCAGVLVGLCIHKVYACMHRIQKCTVSVRAFVCVFQVCQV